MLKAAIEKILEISRPELKEVEGRTFLIGQGCAKEVRPEIDFPSEINLHSLDSLVKMVKTEALNRYPAPLYITVPSHLKVICFSQPDEDRRNIRQFFYEAQATDVPGWESTVQLKFEEAMIAIRTRFQESKDSLYALKLLSDISGGAKITYSDNGIATSVVTKTGISMQTNEAIRPIISLRPYRTFQEVEQPQSQFLIRVEERGIKFIEADGGMWKLEARKIIKQYLDEAFASEIEAGTVVVAL